MSGLWGSDRGNDPGATWRTIMLVVMALLGAAVLVALILTLGHANRRRDEALGLQSHSYEVMILARSLAGTIAGAEASLGRYVISGDRSLGSQYADQWQLAGGQLDRLDQVTGDNPTTQRVIDRLRAAFHKRGDELALTAANTSYHRNDQALARYYQAGQATSLAEINALLDQVIARERTLLEQRSQDAEGSVERSTAVAKVLAIFGILIVIGAVVLGWLTIQAIGERALSEAEAEDERARADELAAAVARSTAELREQETRLRQVQKMEAVGQLTGGVAHDFNNMLAVIVGGIELAQRSLPTDPFAARRQLERAMEGAERATALTRRLLAFSREQALTAEVFTPTALVGGMSDLLDRTLGDGIVVTVEDLAGEAMVRADRHQLENVLLNLAVNARDAMEGRGRLHILTAVQTLTADDVHGCAAGEHVTLAVTDTGCGMPAEVAERVFEPFFTTKPVGRGTGLGLSQAFAFAQTAGGGITLVSEPDHGTTITLLLPRAGSQAGAPALIERPAVTMVPTSGLDILVVEDDPRVLTATVEALEELGHRPIPCPDPFHAPALLDSHPTIDLIVSDVLMPGQTGPEMIAALPARHTGIGVLFVTGYAGDVEDQEDFGGCQVLRKPFTLTALERAVGDAAAARIATASIAAE